MFDGIHKGLSRLATIFAYLAMLAMLLMAFHVFANVVVRILTRRDVAGTLEIVTYYYMVALVFLPMAFVQQAGGHIRADLLSRYMANRAGTVVEVLTQIAMAVFFTLLGWKALESVLEQMGRGEVIQGGGGLFVVWPARWMLPVGLALAALYAVMLAIDAARGSPQGARHAPTEV
jgi:TRAP-type C4-dicarboxylate transport system permease small subunit